MNKVEDVGFIPPEFVETETQWFYEDLGIDDMYFSTYVAPRHSAVQVGALPCLY